MTEIVYTSICIKPETKTRLGKAKVTKGEYWDDLINRLLADLEEQTNMSKNRHIKKA